MIVFLAGSCPVELNSYAPKLLEEFRAFATGDRVRQHTLAAEPSDADIIIFVDNHFYPGWRLDALLEHPFLQRFPERCMVYDERDHPWNALPGIYASMPAKFFDAGSQRAWAYYRLSGNTVVRAGAAADLLYSFMGTPGHRTSGGNRVRREILSLRDDRALIEDTSGFVFFDDRGDPAAHAARQRRFAETIGRSKFVLCPRGAGTSSFRLYEVMRAGRVPVIIADQWVAPIGPDWSKFSIRLGQAAVGQIPDILRQREADWEGMAAEAGAAYCKWFAPDVNFHNIVEQCRSIVDGGICVDAKLRAARYRDLRRRYALAAARTNVGRVLRAIKLRH